MKKINKRNILEIMEDETTYTIVYEKIKKENETDEINDTMDDEIIDEIIDESAMDDNETEIDEDVELDENENDVIEDEETEEETFLSSVKQAYAFLQKRY